MDGLKTTDREALVAAILTAAQIDSGDGPKGAVRIFQETLRELKSAGGSGFAVASGRKGLKE